MIPRIGPLGVSVLLHGALALALISSGNAGPKEESVVEFDVFKPPPPPPPPPPPEPEPQAEPEPPPPPPKPKLTTKVRRVRAKPKPFEPEAEPPPPEPPKPPPGFALELESTVGTGVGISVRAVEGGGNIYADPDREDLKPGKPTAAPPPPPPKPTPVLEVTRMPDCPQPSMKYPPEARRQGLEGVVRLRLMIDESGKVTKIKLVKKAHPLLDKAAKDLVRAMRCKPGRAGKQKVAVPIPYDVTFLLDDW